MTQAMSTAIYDEYENFVKKYRHEYGEKVVVFMQVGSFYEMYSAADENSIDIKTIAELLNITVTRKNKSISTVDKSNCNMCGFPMYCLSKYIDMLTGHNYTIIVVNQVSMTPKPKREVVEICSPGTQVIDKGTGESNYLMTVCFDEQIDHRSKNHNLVIGVAYIDLSTGQNYVYETSSKPNDTYYGLDELHRIILSTSPRELLFLGDVKSLSSQELLKRLEIGSRCVHDKLNTYDPCFCKLHFQEQIVSKLFPKHGLLSPLEFIGLDRNPIAAISYVAMLDFVYKHSEIVLEKIVRPTFIQDDKHLIISYNTLKQLDVIKCGENVYLESILNNCTTAIGKRRFRDRLLNPLNDVETINKQYDITGEMIKNNTYQGITKQLQHISDIERQFRRIIIGKLHPFEFISIKQSLEVVIYLLNANTNKGMQKEINTTDIEAVLAHIHVLNFEACGRCNLDSIDTNIFTTGHNTEIDKLSQEIDKDTMFFDELARSLNNLNETYANNKFFKVDFNDKDGYFLTITNKRYTTVKVYANENPGVSQQVSHWLDTFEVRKLSSTSSISKIWHKEFQDKNEAIAQNKTMLKEKVTAMYKHFLKSCHCFENVFGNVVEYVANLDYYTNNAKNAVCYGYCRPFIDDRENSKSYISATQLRHPIIERIQQNVEYIANDVELGLNDENGILLYGINAAGKSSLMKSIGLSIIMAQAGMYVPCSSFSYFPYKHIFSRIPSGDNLSRGQSTFTNEIGEIRDILQRANGASLVIGDELCSGTESISAMSIVSAGIMTLMNKKATFIFATHLHDLTNIPQIKKMKNLRVYHLSVIFDTTTGKLIYDRQLKPGQGNTLYGLEVCKALNLGDEFLALAQSIRREILQTEDTIVTKKKSRYNSKLLVDSCIICHCKADEVHHIKEQHKADENGMIGHIHKNSFHNLVKLCAKCHDDIHAGKITLKGFYRTSAGTELVYDAK